MSRIYLFFFLFRNIYVLYDIIHIVNEKFQFLPLSNYFGLQIISSFNYIVDSIIKLNEGVHSQDVLSYFTNIRTTRHRTKDA